MAACKHDVLPMPEMKGTAVHVRPRPSSLSNGRRGQILAEFGYSLSIASLLYPSPLGCRSMLLSGRPDASHKPTQMRGFEMALPEQPQEEKRRGS